MKTALLDLAGVAAFLAFVGAIDLVMFALAK